jgi:hypothetical protein
MNTDKSIDEGERGERRKDLTQRSERRERRESNGKPTATAATNSKTTTEAKEPARRWRYESQMRPAEAGRYKVKSLS